VPGHSVGGVGGDSKKSRLDLSKTFVSERVKTALLSEAMRLHRRRRFMRRQLYVSQFRAWIRLDKEMTAKARESQAKLKLSLRKTFADKSMAEYTARYESMFAPPLAVQPLLPRAVMTALIERGFRMQQQLNCVAQRCNQMAAATTTSSTTTTTTSTRDLL
jgi:hypothetical protein